MIENKYSYQDLDSLFHAPARLGIATALYAHESGLTFAELKRACGLSDGNLSRHLTKLEEGGAVVVSKEFVDRVPQTTATLSPDGRSRFESYLEHLRTIVEGDASMPRRTMGPAPERNV